MYSVILSQLPMLPNMLISLQLMLTIFSECSLVGTIRSVHPRWGSIYGWCSYCLSNLWRKWSSYSFLPTATSRNSDSCNRGAFYLFIANSASAVASSYHDYWLYGSDVLPESPFGPHLQVPLQFVDDSVFARLETIL